MDAAGDLSEFDEYIGELGSGGCQRLSYLRWLFRKLSLGRSQSKGQTDQTLLNAVVQITLDASPRLIGGANETGAGLKQFASRSCIGNRRRNELGKFGEALLGPHGNRPPGPATGNQEAPDPAVNDDRHA
jgi:hypothetical protein